MTIQYSLFIFKYPWSKIKLNVTPVISRCVEWQFLFSTNAMTVDMVAISVTLSDEKWTNKKSEITCLNVNERWNNAYKFINKQICTVDYNCVSLSLKGKKQMKLAGIHALVEFSWAGGREGLACDEKTLLFVTTSWMIVQVIVQVHMSRNSIK